MRQHRERENEGDSQPDREVVSLYQERAALAGSSLSVVVPLIQSAAASASEAPGWAKTPRVPSPRPAVRPGGPRQLPRTSRPPDCLLKLALVSALSSLGLHTKRCE